MAENERLTFESVLQQCDGLPVHVSFNVQNGTYIEFYGRIQYGDLLVYGESVGPIHPSYIASVRYKDCVYSNPEWEDGGIRIYIEAI